MALNTYDDLKAEIVAVLARSDISASDTQIDTYIDLFEAEASLRVQHRKMEKTLTGIASTNNNYTLPTDFIGVSTLNIAASPKQIDYYPRSRFSDVTLNDSYTYAYTLINGANDEDIIRVANNGTFDLTYLRAIPALSASNTTNWLLKRYPDAYLSGSVYFAFRRLRNALAADYKGLMDAAIDTLNTDSERTTSGGGGMRAMVNGTIV